MPLQLVGVLAGVAAQKALEGALPRVRADVALQLTGLGKEARAPSTRQRPENLPFISITKDLEIAPRLRSARVSHPNTVNRPDFLFSALDDGFHLMCASELLGG